MNGFRELIALHVAEGTGRIAERRQESLRAELATMDERLAGLRGFLHDAEEALANNQSERRRLEGEVEGLETQQEKYRTQLMQAKTNEVYRTLLSEIETSKEQISERETRILELMESAEQAQAKVDGLRQELAAAETANATESKRLTAEVAALDVTRDEARQQAVTVRERVPGKYAAAYDRIAAGRGGRACALADNELCGECHETVRLQTWVEILRESELHLCHGCGRILYRKENLDQGSGATGSATPARAGG